MYVELIKHHPAPGRAQELRAGLEEWARTAPSRGATHNLTSALLDPEGAVLINGIRHDDLAAFGAYRQAAVSRPHAPYPPDLLDRPPERTLWEVLVPAPVGGGEPPRYSFRITLYPAAGKAPAVRALLEEWVKAQQAGGSRQTLAIQVFGQEGPVFAQTILHPDLASLEARMRSFQADPGSAAFGEKLAPLLARPGKAELFQVLVPFPRA